MPRTMLRIGALPPLQVSPATLVTVLLVAVLMFPSLRWPGVSGGQSALVALCLGLFLILSVLVHELAHALVARAFGARVDHIALTLWGGHTQYRAERMPAIGSVLVSLAGPASNAALAGITHVLELASWSTGPVTTALVVATRLNLALAVFNLLPGLPMDGGRTLESLLGAVLRRPVLGTQITAWIGRLLAISCVAVPLWWIVRDGGADIVSLIALVWGMLIAGLLWQGAGSALAQAQVEARVGALDSAALLRPLRLVAPHTPLAALDAEAPDGGGGPDTPAARVLLLDRSAARPGTVGRGLVLDPEAVAAVPSARRAEVSASAVARPLGDVVALRTGLGGEELVSAMLARPAPVYLVVDPDGRPQGVILSADMNTLLRGR